MSSRFDAKINEAIPLIMDFTSDKDNTYFDPYEIDRVEILNDAGDILETIAVGSISKVNNPDGNPVGSFQITTSTTWNTFARGVVDRWWYRVEAGSTLLPTTSHCVIRDADGVSPPRCVDEKTGYAFDNYTVPTGEWGVAGTPDDMRYHYLYGIELVAQNEQEVEDTQLKHVIDLAMGKVETLLGIDIRKRIYKTEPADSLTRGVIVKPGVDYTNIEDVYPFRPQAWKNYGFVQLRHYPLLSVERAVLYGITHTELIDLIDAQWLRLEEKDAGQLTIYPKFTTFQYGPPTAASGLLWLTNLFKGQYPGGYEFDYTTGYYNSDFMPPDLREVVMKIAAIGALQWIGDGLLAGFSSSSISLDGLSEAFSSTQSATSSYFGARILSYQNEVKEWLKKNRYKYSNVPLAFA